MLKLFFKNTKMIHARRILAWHTVLTVLPAVVGIVLLLCMPTALTRVVGCLAGIVVFLVLLIKGAPRAIELQVASGLLKAQKHDRKFFVPRTEPRSRSEWSDAVIEGCHRMRLKEAPCPSESEYAPIYVGSKNTASFGSDQLECFAFLYSVETLDGEVYAGFLRDAKKRLREFPTRDKAKHKTRHLKIQYGTASCMVILADKVDEETAKRVKEYAEVRDGSLFSAIVDCPRNRVYMEGSKHLQAMDESDSQSMIGRLVFGTSGQIPRDGGEHTDEYLELCRKFEEQTYGEFLGESIRTEQELEEEEQRLFTEMREGEFRLVEQTLYCMAEGKLMSLIFLPKDASDEPLSVPAKSAGQVLTYDAFFLSWDLPKSKEMSEQDKAVYLPRMIAYMESAGYQVEKEED